MLSSDSGRIRGLTLLALLIRVICLTLTSFAYQSYMLLRRSYSLTLLALLIRVIFLTLRIRVISLTLTSFAYQSYMFNSMSLLIGIIYYNNYPLQG